MAEPTINDELVIIDETPTNPSLPTPEEVIAAEQGNPAPVEAESTEPSPEELATIELKLNAGEELTTEEKAIADKIDQEVAEPAPVVPAEPVIEEKFKIGKDEFTSSQVEEKMRAELNLGKLDISKDAKEKMLQMYVKSQNRSEAQVAVAKGFEENAQTRQVLSMERSRLEQAAKSLVDAEARLVAKQQKLSKTANSPIEEKDIYNELNQVDLTKFAQFQDKNRAVQDLEEINDELRAIQGQKTDTQRNVRIAMANEFVLSHPEFKPVTGDIVDLATKINQGVEIDLEDEIRVRELTRLMDEAINGGLTLEKSYAIESRRGNLAVKPIAQSIKEPEPKVPTNLPKNPKTLAQKVAEFRAKSAKASPDTGSPSVPLPAKKPTTASELIRSDQTTLGTNTRDPMVRSLGY